MKLLSEFKSPAIRVLFTDIDGTLTERGRLPASSYAAMECLTASGIDVVPVTGRPAGWCELIARLWPVHGVIGENGAFYFRLKGSKMHRHFALPREQRLADRKKLKAIRAEVLREVPGAAVASDQFCRLFDLAIDFQEDVKSLSADKIECIVKAFHRHGATAKVSNIHVNGWFGDYDKLSMCTLYARNELELNEQKMKLHCAFAGDSPNDEPMFQFFPNSFAVANIAEFEDRIRFKPAFVAKGREAAGFCEVANLLLEQQRKEKK